MKYDETIIMNRYKFFELELLEIYKKIWGSSDDFEHDEVSIIEANEVSIIETIVEEAIEVEEVPIIETIVEENIETIKENTEGEVEVKTETDYKIMYEQSELEKQQLEARLKFISGELRRLKLNKSVNDTTNVIEKFNYTFDGKINSYNFETLETHIEIKIINFIIRDTFDYPLRVVVASDENNVVVGDTVRESNEPPATSGTCLVKMQRKNGVIVQDCDVYIGPRCFSGGWRLEKTKWSPPFTVKQYKEDKEKYIKIYREYLISSNIINDIGELKDKKLGCWCSTNEECHGNVLLGYVSSLGIDTSIE